MANSWCHMLFYLLVCVWLVECFPASVSSVSREHKSVPDNSDTLNFNGSKIVIIHFENARNCTRINKISLNFFEDQFHA